MKKPKSLPPRTKISFISILPSQDIMEALTEIRKEYGDVIELKVYGVHQVESGEVPEDDFRRDLKESQLVFVDGRGGDRLKEIVMETLQDTSNAVLGSSLSFGSYYGSSQDSLFIRMGKLKSWGMRGVRGLLNSKVRWKILEMVVCLFDRKVNLRNIVQSSGLTSVKDPQRLMDSMMRMERMLKFLPGLGAFKDLKNMIFLFSYFGFGGKENMKNFLLLSASQYGNLKLRKKIRPPLITKEDTIYYPDAPYPFTRLNNYLKWRGMEKKVSVGMISYGMQFSGWSRPVMDVFIQTLEEKVNVIPVYASSLAWWKTIENFFFKDGRPVIDLLLWVPAYHRMTGGPMWINSEELFGVLQKLNVPLLAPFGMAITSHDLWKRSNVITPLDELCGIAAPELDGAIEPLPVCAMAGELRSNGKLMQTLPIPDRCFKSCERALRWIGLKSKENRDKKVAIVIYGLEESNLGGGAGFLDVFQSLIKLLSRMKEEGYDVEVPKSKEDLLSLFLDRGQLNTSNWCSKDLTARYAVKVTSEKYEEWLSGIPDLPREKIVCSWGNSPGEIMVQSGELLLPGVFLGKVFIGLQPSLGDPDNPEELLKSFHDKLTSPTHQYLAFYKWIEENFDALIHFGTHGTLEWRAGKEVGLSEECFPDLLIGNLPHIYLYWVGDTSEATLAKRRSYALMVSHLSSPYAASGLYDEYQEIEDLIHEYYDAQNRDPDRARLVRERIAKIQQRVHLGGEIEEVYDKVCEMKRAIIPQGLHILGENFSHEEIVEYVTLTLRYDRGEIKSLHHIIASEEGYHYLDLVKYPGKEAGGKTYAQVLEDIERVVRQVVWELMARRDVRSVALEMFAGSKKNTFGDIERTLSFVLDTIERACSSDELSGMMRALSGGYLLPRKGGDMVRNPQVLPTGGNMYGLDPTKVPTEVAYQRGAEMAEEMLRQHLAREGKYPESIGIVLWGFETMNTGGETIGEILRLVGVEVISSLTDRRSGWGYLSDLRVIPVSDLGRPRVDVMVTICGMFRDQFPHLMEMLDKAFKLVSDLSEEDNLVAQHTQELKQRSKELGIDPELCHLRVFGPQSSEYGTGTLTFLIENSSWRDENELSQAYISGMKHLYGKNVSAREAQMLMGYHAQNVELISQIRDFADYEVTDLDHYYEFSGGLATMAKEVSGRRPPIFINDTTKEVVKTEDIKGAIERGARTRTLNPRWIEKMLEHGYDGVLNIEDRVEYLLGLAATTEGVANWIWDEVADRIALNEEVKEKVEEANPWALQEIIDHLLEAKERGYWEASGERLERLKDILLEVEGWFEERSDLKPSPGGR